MLSTAHCFGFALTVALLVGASPPAVGQHVVSRFTVDGGGGTRSSGGSFALGGTIGQPDAGLLSGPGFTLAGGFWSGRTSPVTDVEPPTAAPRVFRMYSARPNPVVERTLIAFDLPAPTAVRAALYDASGRLVRTLADGALPAGRHERAWDRRDRAGRVVPPGIFFLRLDAGVLRRSQKLVVVR